MKDRIALESVILSMSMEGCFSMASDILKKENFSQTILNPHKEIWSVMSLLYPEKPIDIITVGNKYSELYQRNINTYLVEINKGVTNDRIGDYCLCLLERDIRSKLIYELKLEEARLLKSSNFVLSARYLELLKHISDLELDFFDLLESVRKYLEALHTGEVPIGIQRIFEAIPDRIKQIKNKSGLKTLTTHLMRRVMMSGESEIQEDAERLAIKLGRSDYG